MLKQPHPNPLLIKERENFYFRFDAFASFFRGLKPKDFFVFITSGLKRELFVQLYYTRDRIIILSYGNLRKDI